MNNNTGKIYIPKDGLPFLMDGTEDDFNFLRSKICDWHTLPGNVLITDYEEDGQDYFTLTVTFQPDIEISSFLDDYKNLGHPFIDFLFTTMHTSKATKKRGNRAIFMSNPQPRYDQTYGDLIDIKFIISTTIFYNSKIVTIHYPNNSDETEHLCENIYNWIIKNYPNYKISLSPLTP